MPDGNNSYHPLLYLVTKASNCTSDEEASNLLLVNTSINSNCPWTIHMTFKCTVIINEKGGSTVWQGNALSECEGTSTKEITLPHTKFESHSIISCNNGTITGQSLNMTIENGSILYTSQLDVIVMPEMVGKIIECLHDDGTSESSTCLNVSTSINVCMQTMNATSIYMGAGEGTILCHEHPFTTVANN